MCENINSDDYEFIDINEISHSSCAGKKFIDMHIADDHTFFIESNENLVLSHNCDGNHIFGLLVAMVKKFWPEVLEMGVFHKFITPIAKIQQGKTEKWFYSLDEYNNWITANGNKPFNSRYLKGLGSSTAKDFTEYFKQIDKNLICVKVDSKKDLDVIDLVFGKDVGSADKRKLWLELE